MALHQPVNSTDLRSCQATESDAAASVSIIVKMSGLLGAEMMMY
jgi:hypothetical protein